MKIFLDENSISKYQWFSSNSWRHLSSTRHVTNNSRWWKKNRAHFHSWEHWTRKFIFNVTSARNSCPRVNSIQENEESIPSPIDRSQAWHAHLKKRKKKKIGPRGLVSCISINRISPMKYQDNSHAISAANWITFTTTPSLPPFFRYLPENNASEHSVSKSLVYLSRN